MTTAIYGVIPQATVAPSEHQQLEQQLLSVLKSPRTHEQCNEALALVKGIDPQTELAPTKLAILLLTANVPGVVQDYDDYKLNLLIKEKARGLLLCSLKANPDDVDALAYLALLFERAGNTFISDAKADLETLPYGITEFFFTVDIVPLLLEKALQIDSSHQVATILKAEMELENARQCQMLYPQAVDTLRAVLAKNPHNIFALQVLGHFLSAQHQPSRIAEYKIQNNENTTVPSQGIVYSFDAYVHYAAQASPEERKRRICLADEGEQMKRDARSTLFLLNTGLKA